jgi:hypothetical protein
MENRQLHSEQQPSQVTQLNTQAITLTKYAENGKRTPMASLEGCGHCAVRGIDP